MRLSPTLLLLFQHFPNFSRAKMLKVFTTSKVTRTWLAEIMESLRRQNIRTFTRNSLRNFKNQALQCKAFSRRPCKRKWTESNLLPEKKTKRFRHDCNSMPVPLLSERNCDLIPVHVISYMVGVPDYSTAGASPNPYCSTQSYEKAKIRNTAVDTQSLISNAFKTIADGCYDVWPLIRDHALGIIPQVPLEEDERSVVSYFIANTTSREKFMKAILQRIKNERALMKHTVRQSLCRVYVALCEQRREYHKARAFAYRLLKEGFPEAPKLILFILTTWPGLLFPCNPLSQAINIVIYLKAKGEVFECLRKYLHWDKWPPATIESMIPRILRALLKDHQLTFRKSEWYGEDLCPASWEYVFSIDLLCIQKGWPWTFKNFIRYGLFRILDIWLIKPRSQQVPSRDVCVAVVLRLIGRLGQLGLKQTLKLSVEFVAKRIILFGKQGLSKGIPREVLLSVVYTTHDFAASNPKEALEALTSWQTILRQPVPPAVPNCIQQLRSLCKKSSVKALT